MDIDKELEDIKRYSRYTYKDIKEELSQKIMKDMVRKEGWEKEFSILSRAATREEIGNDIYPPAKRTLDAHHIPYTKRGAALITDKDYDAADYIIAMDQEAARTC